jgi:hypothetical protein
VVAFKDDLCPVLVCLVVVPVLDGVRVEVGALGYGLEELGCLRFGRCCAGGGFFWLGD